jgi:hypothetical protein
VLLIGKNGSKNTTIGFALQILQKIARGKNRRRSDWADLPSSLPDDYVTAASITLPSRET